MNVQNDMLMEIPINIITPIWTGGASGKVDRIHETGIIGSMRWWYEAIVRGFGGACCNTNENPCIFNQARYNDSTETDSRNRLRDAGLCDVCQIFGTTGWRRQFRISILQDNTRDAEISSIVHSSRNYDSKGKKVTPKWYFKLPGSSLSKVANTPKIGTFRIKLFSLSKIIEKEIIAGLLLFISKYAAIGARAQMGFGIVTINLNNPATTIIPFLDLLNKLNNSSQYPELPSLSNLFFTEFETDRDSHQTTFDIKYDLRRLFSNSKEIRHFVMGAVKPHKIASKINISKPFNKNIRIWGWIPECLPECDSKWNRDRIIEQIHGYITDLSPNLHYWREMNTNRDTVNSESNSNPEAFLHSLFQEDLVQ